MPVCSWYHQGWSRSNDLRLILEYYSVAPIIMYYDIHANTAGRALLLYKNGSLPFRRVAFFLSALGIFITTYSSRPWLLRFSLR